MIDGQSYDFKYMKVGQITNLIYIYIYNKRSLRSSLLLIFDRAPHSVVSKISSAIFLNSQFLHFCEINTRCYSCNVSKFSFIYFHSAHFYIYCIIIILCNALSLKMAFHANHIGFQCPPCLYIFFSLCPYVK